MHIIPSPVFLQEDTKVRTLVSSFVLVVLPSLIICAACANCPSAKSKRAGFKPAPTNPDSFLRPLRFLRLILRFRIFFACGAAAL